LESSISDKGVSSESEAKIVSWDYEIEQLEYHEGASVHLLAGLLSLVDAEAQKHKLMFDHQLGSI